MIIMKEKDSVVTSDEERHSELPSTPLPLNESSSSSGLGLRSSIIVSNSNQDNEDYTSNNDRTKWTSATSDGHSSVKAEPATSSQSESSVCLTGKRDSVASCRLSDSPKADGGQEEEEQEQEGEEKDTEAESDGSVFKESDHHHFASPFNADLTKAYDVHSTQFHLSSYDNMQTAYPAMSSDSSIRDSYAMQSANAASALGAAFQYNSSAYGLGLTAGQPYNSGTRSISQSYKGSASMAQPAFNFAYSHFGNSGSQPTPPSYCYGGYPPNYGGSLSASAAASSSPPTSQNFASSCQQSVDYSHYGYNQGYYGGQPAYPHALYSTGNGSATGSTSHSANGTPLPLTNSNSSSPPTYQLAQLPSPDTNNSSHNYHPSLENDSTPPLKASPLELPPANGNINNLNVTNKKGKSGRGRGRRVANASPPPEQTLDRVFIWDLDETLIHQHSLLNGGYAKHYHKSLDVLELLGRDVELLGYDMADNYFFGKDLEHCDQVHVDDVSADDTGQDLSTYNFETDGFADTGPSCGLSLPTAGVRGGVDWMRKLSFRYRKIRENYSHYCDRVGEMMGDRHAHWMRVIQEIENQTDCWTTTARKCLAIVNQRENSANILVSENQLVCAISKLLVNDLGQFFQIDNIYSSGKVGNKEHIFERIQQKYGKKCTYVVIGDTSKEEEAAKKLSMPFWRISSHSDLHNLHRALSLDML